MTHHLRGENFLPETKRWYQEKRVKADFWDFQFQARYMGMEEMTQEENNFGEKENKDSQIRQHLWISYCVQWCAVLCLEIALKDTAQVFGGTYSLTERQKIFSMKCKK